MTEVAPAPVENLSTHDVASNEQASTEVKTVFHDPQAFTVKHPLINKWTLWYTKPPSAGQRGVDAWADNLKEVITFDSVEEFWGIYNNIAKATDLGQKSDYHLFKQGVRPEWEDKQNQKGGKWAFQSKGASKEFLDDMWLYSMLAAIGETLEREGDNEVMGVVVNLRKAHWRISVWTRTCTNKEGLLEVGRRFKEILKLPASETLDFASHNDAAHSGSSRAKARMSRYSHHSLEGPFTFATHSPRICIVSPGHVEFLKKPTSSRGTKTSLQSAAAVLATYRSIVI